MNWKPIAEPIPQHVAQLLVVDSKFRLLLMHRSDKVKSAKNVWSFPSGTHEIGETIEECACRELFEEYSLQAYPGRTRHVGLYENIAGDPEPGAQQYHWLLSVLGIYVPDVSLAVNNEPDKHDKMEFVTIGEIARPDFFQEYPFHETFTTWALPRGFEIQTQLTNLILQCR